MDPAIHTRVAKTAKALGMDINGLLNLIIRSHLYRYEDLSLGTSRIKTGELLPRWQQLNPTENPENFWWDLYVIHRKKLPAFFEDGKYYLLNDAGDDFVDLKLPGGQGSLFKEFFELRKAFPGESDDQILKRLANVIEPPAEASEEPTEQRRQGDEAATKKPR
jgi:hypothetical protein